MRVWERKPDGLWGQHLSPGAFLAADVDTDYFSNDIHYKAIARRIVATPPCSGRFVLITGDPPPSPQALCGALRSVAGDRYDVVIICCEPELTGEKLERLLAGPAREATAGVSGGSPLSTASSLLVFDGFERLSNKQIEEICAGSPHPGSVQTAGILLAPSDFLARLEEESLHVLRDCLANCFRFQEVGDDEAIAFLHNQLLAQRDRRIEARGFRRGILIGLTAGGVTLAGSVGTFLVLHRATETVLSATTNLKEKGSASESAPSLQPTPKATASIERTEGAQDMETAPSLTDASPPVNSTVVEGSPRSTPPAVTHPSAEPQPATPEITALVTRGDAFLSLDDITSARLFYERAADAGSGVAALQLGATFDPQVVSRSGLHGAIKDRAQALSWYRRARDLGVAEAERRIERLELRPGNEVDTRSR